MRIGILTQKLLNNYGGLLQNYALQKVLCNNGHEPITMDWEFPRVSSWHQNLYMAKKIFFHYINGTPIPRYALTDEETKVISRNNRKFIESYVKVSPLSHSKEEFLKFSISNNISAFVVGSDQCWRPRYNGGFLHEMFLSFASGLDVKRVAYAASFGTDEWEFSENDTQICRELVKKFDTVSVREISGVRLCKDYLGVDAEYVLDPTLLLDRNEYELIVEAENIPKSCGNLFHYILDPSSEKTDFINRVAEMKGLAPFTVMPKYQAETRTKQNIKNEIENCVFPSVLAWLRGFIDSEMVIVDSFHGCVFSIIFNKPFWVLSNVSRGNARFSSLLNLFGLEDRLVESFDNIDIDKPIRWNEVNDILEKKRTHSLKFLIESLKEK